MNERELLEALRRHRLLSEVSDEQLIHLSAAASGVDYARDSVLFREGDAASFALLIVSGAVSLELCAPAVGCRRILTAGPGELVGWSAVLGQSTYSATARAKEDVRGVRLDAAKLHEAFHSDYRLGYELMRRTAQTLSKRLGAARLQAADLYGASSPHVEHEGA